MQIINKQLKQGKIKLGVDSLDDLWYLSQIIEPGDHVEGKTERKIKIKGKDDQTKAVTKKTFWLKLKVEKVHIHEYSDLLKIQGVVAEGHEKIPIGSHHSFNVEVGTKITIIKESWLNYQLKQLKESAENKLANILICVLDRESAFFAILRNKGYEILSELKGSVSKKIDQEISTSNFYKEIITSLKEYQNRFELKSIIVASPAFWKEDLLKQINDDHLKRKIVLATCNTAEKPAIQEILNRDEIKKVLEDQRFSKEVQLVEQLLSEISKNQKAVYGFSQTKTAVDSGAVENLLITTDIIHAKKQEDSFEEINKLMQQTEKMQGQISIINSKNQAGRKLDSLGGIAGLLRYKIN